MKITISIKRTLRSLRESCRKNIPKTIEYDESSQEKIIPCNTEVKEHGVETSSLPILLDNDSQDKNLPIIEVSVVDNTVSNNGRVLAAKPKEEPKSEIQIESKPEAQIKPIEAQIESKEESKPETQISKEESKPEAQIETPYELPLINSFSILTLSAERNIRIINNIQADEETKGVLVDYETKTIEKYSKYKSLLSDPETAHKFRKLLKSKYTSILTETNPIAYHQNLREEMKALADLAKVDKVLVNLYNELEEYVDSKIEVKKNHPFIEDDAPLQLVRIAEKANVSQLTTYVDKSYEKKISNVASKLEELQKTKGFNMNKIECTHISKQFEDFDVFRDVENKREYVLRYDGKWQEDIIR